MVRFEDYLVVRLVLKTMVAPQYFKESLKQITFRKIYVLRVVPLLHRDS